MLRNRHGWRRARSGCTRAGALGGTRSPSLTGSRIMTAIVRMTKRVAACWLGVALTTTAAVSAQQPFAAGSPLGYTVDGKFVPMSANVKVYGAVVNAESCSYDAVR